MLEYSHGCDNVMLLIQNHKIRRFLQASVVEAGVEDGIGYGITYFVGMTLSN